MQKHLLRLLTGTIALLLIGLAGSLLGAMVVYTPEALVGLVAIGLAYLLGFMIRTLVEASHL